MLLILRATPPRIIQMRLRPPYEVLALFEKITSYVLKAALDRRLPEVEHLSHGRRIRVDITRLAAMEPCRETIQQSHVFASTYS